MKALNKTSAAIFQAAIDRIPAGETRIKLDAGDHEHGGSIMALCVEKIGVNEYGDLYSFAHYYLQNGDMMRDPDVVMLRSINPDALTGKHQFFPISYRQDGLGIDRDSVIFNTDGPGWKIDKRGQADLCAFCNLWAGNLRGQQGLVPARAVVAHVSENVAQWLDPAGTLQAAGLMKVTL